MVYNTQVAQLCFLEKSGLQTNSRTSFKSSIWLPASPLATPEVHPPPHESRIFCCFKNRSHWTNQSYRSHVLQPIWLRQRLKNNTLQQQSLATTVYSAFTLSALYKRCSWNVKHTRVYKWDQWLKRLHNQAWKQMEVNESSLLGEVAILDSAFKKKGVHAKGQHTL